MLKYRLIFGPLMIGLALGMFYMDARFVEVTLSGFWSDLFAGRSYPPPGLLLLPLFILLIGLAAWELVNIFQAVGLHKHYVLTAFSAVVACVSLYATPMAVVGPTGVSIVGTVLIGCFVLTLIWHSRDANVKGVIAAAGAVMFGVALLGLMPGFMLAIRRWHSGWVLIGIILITKSGDIGAYITGRAIGKHKLIPWLSPGKTWEGLFGAVVLATIVAVAFAYLTQATEIATTYVTDPQTGDRRQIIRQYSMGWAALAGVIFALVGHAGDLMMSMFKRDAGIKDSGRIIPGFGGILDVLDSPLLVAPIAFWLLEAAAFESSVP